MSPSAALGRPPLAALAAGSGGREREQRQQRRAPDAAGRRRRRRCIAALPTPASAPLQAFSLAHARSAACVASCSGRAEPEMGKDGGGRGRLDHRRRWHRLRQTADVSPNALGKGRSGSSSKNGATTGEQQVSTSSSKGKNGESEAAAATAGGNGSASSSSSSPPSSSPRPRPTTPDEVAALLARSAEILRRQEEIAKLQAETARELSRALAEARASASASPSPSPLPRSDDDESDADGVSPSPPPPAPSPTIVIPNRFADNLDDDDDEPAAAFDDARARGEFDARFHSTSVSATPRDLRVLPKRIVLVRHAESEGNVDSFAYTYMPDPQVPLTERGVVQARSAGEAIRDMFEVDDAFVDFSAPSSDRARHPPYKLHFYMSPYKRSRQTCEAIASCFPRGVVTRIQEDVQLREQDFGNFQDAAGKEREKAERLRFGRFFYRFPNGESGADVYDRMTLFEDHLVRDINAGRFSEGTSLVLVTHGLALRIFLMRWFHWTVSDFLECYNPPNAAPVVLERTISPWMAPGSGGRGPRYTTDSDDGDGGRRGAPSVKVHTKALYRLSPASRLVLRGCTEEMCYLN